MVGDLTHGPTVGDDEDPSLAHADAEAVEFADDAMNRGSGHASNIQKTKRLASVKSDRVRPCSSRLNMREQRHCSRPSLDGEIFDGRLHGVISADHGSGFLDLLAVRSDGVMTGAEN
jgi:hypothetical protein